MQKVFKDIMQKFTARENLIFVIQKINNNTYKFDENIKADLIQFTTLLNTKYNTSVVDMQVVDGMDTGSYYYLSKAMLPENITMMVDNGLEPVKAIKLESPIIESLKEMGQWYVDNVYTYWASNYGANRTDKGLIYYDDDNNGSNESWHFPVDDETYKSQFLKRFKEKYKNSSKLAKDKRTNNIKTKSSDVLDENYLDISAADMIDTNWKTYEICNRDKRGNETTILKIINVDVPNPIVGQPPIKIPTIATESVIKGVSHRGTYKCDLVDNKKVGDDCSAFASAVLYKFIKDNHIGEYEKYNYLNSWGSSHFLKTKDEKDTKKIKETKVPYILEKYGFKQYTAGEIKKINEIEQKKFQLQPGDLLCKKGHVEFYKGNTNSSSFGWGDVHSSYDNNLGITFTANADGTYTGSGSSELYTVIYRYEGLK